VLVLDDLSSGRLANLDDAMSRGASLSEGSVTDGRFVADQAAEFAPELIFHLAAQVDVRKAVADPTFDATVNVLGTINVLEAARQVPGAAVIFASTGGAIYGEGEGRELPFGEAAVAAPESPYGASKLAGEVYLGFYRRMYGVPGVAMRFGNVYGPRQDPHGEAGVVAIFSGLLREGAPLRVFGDGRQTRDYVYVDDVVEALVAAAVARDDAAVIGPYNVGTGREVDVNELAGLLGEVAGSKAEIEYLPERPGEVRRVSIDPAAAADLGWRPETELTEGLRRTYAALAGD
jgi:UDP-glucose 4-epimerase